MPKTIANAKSNERVRRNPTWVCEAFDDGLAITDASYNEIHMKYFIFLFIYNVIALKRTRAANDDAFKIGKKSERSILNAFGILIFYYFYYFVKSEKKMWPADAFASHYFISILCLMFYLWAENLFRMTSALQAATNRIDSTVIHNIWNVANILFKITVFCGFSPIFWRNECNVVSFTWLY